MARKILKCEPLHPETLKTFHANLEKVLESTEPSEDLKALLGGLGANDSDTNAEPNEGFDDNDKESDDDECDPYNIINSSETSTAYPAKREREGKYTFRNIKSIPKVS